MANRIREIIITGALALTASGVRAQNEYFAGDPEWVVVATGFGFSFDCFYSIVGDTIVGGYEYKIVHAAPQSSTSDASLFFYSDNWLRSEGKTIWWYNTELNQEELLYRFEGEIGDTLQIHPALLEQPQWLPTQHFVIDQVDSLLIGSAWRKRFHTAESFYHSVVYEGIGNSDGPFGLMHEGYGFLKCYTWENESYSAPMSWSMDNYTFEAGPCNFDAVIETDGVRLEVFPNPVQDRLTIHSMATQQEIEITDISGRCVYRSSADGSSSFAFIAHLSQGVYVCRVLLSDGNRYAVNFVKE